jgi:thiosulfate dehydrogenase [quinone] large subunit
VNNAVSIDTPLHRGLILFFRIAMGWTFLYAGVTQLIIEPNWSAAAFLTHTKTFHDVLAPFAAPTILPVTDFLVKWGHFLIGLALISGLMVRVSGILGVLLMLVYYMAHLDFPYVETKLNFIMDYHLVYAGVIIYLIAVRAGHVYGLGGYVEKLAVIAENPFLRPLVR